MKDSILVTGGAGYIGSHVIKLLGENDIHTVCYDNLSTGNRSSVLYGDFIEGDLSEIDKMKDLFQNYNIVGVIHFAGSIVVPESVENPLKYYHNNTTNSLGLIELCVDFNVNQFIFSSTAAVYGNVEAEFINENATLAPANPYGESKLMVEKILEDVQHAHPNFNYCILRYFNVSGADPDGKIGQAFPGATHLIKINCEAAAGKRDKVQIFGTDFDTIDGTGVRDYIHVSDLAYAHIEALNYLNKNKKSDVFNCGYGKGFSVKEVISTVKQISGVDYVVEEKGRRQGDPANVVSDPSKILAKTNWKPRFNDLKIIVKTAFEWEQSEVYKSWPKK